jgi:formate-dependent nitrite reductase cytochrome c552 subunit
LFEKELNGELEEGEGVSCASCHMPRKKKGKLVYVEHNQTLNLKPNSKMLRPVCMNCHGLEYATAALADKRLIARNFSGDFIEQHPSFNMVRVRIEERIRMKKERAARNDS